MPLHTGQGAAPSSAPKAAGSPSRSWAGVHPGSVEPSTKRTRGVRQLWSPSIACCEKSLRIGTDQEFSSSNEHLESNTTRVFFIVSFPRIDSKPSPSLSRCSRTRYDSRSP